MLKNLKPDERVDSNFYNFVALLNKQDNLVSYDPMVDNPATFMREKILELAKIRNPQTVFNNISIGESDVNKFCSRI